MNQLFLLKWFKHGKIMHYQKVPCQKNTNGQFWMDIRIIAVKKASVKSIISSQYLKLRRYLIVYLNWINDSRVHQPYLVIKYFQRLPNEQNHRSHYIFFRFFFLISFHGKVGCVILRFGRRDKTIPEQRLVDISSIF